MRTKITIVTLFLTMNIVCMNHEGLEIKPICLSQINEVKQMLTECAFELWHPYPTIEEFIKKLDETDEFKDLDALQSAYFDNNGIFYVLVDNNKIVGAGAIRWLTDELCELKRMWFLKEYRGRGLGLAMANKLLEFAKAQGYKKIRLDVYQPEMQTRAVAFYTKLGFYEIEPYNNSPAKLFMEKAL